MEGSEFREMRDALGMTVKEMADLLNVTPSAIYKWEAGINPIRGISDTAVIELNRRLIQESDGVLALDNKTPLLGGSNQ